MSKYHVQIKSSIVNDHSTKTYLARPHHPEASNNELRSSPSLVLYLASINCGSAPQIFNLPPVALNS